MEWFCLLLQKCEQALEQILDGSLTCSVLESRGEHPSSAESIQLVILLIYFIFIDFIYLI